MTTVRIFYNQYSARDKEYIDMAYKGVDNFVNAFMQQNLLDPE